MGWKQRGGKHSQAEAVCHHGAGQPPAAATEESSLSCGCARAGPEEPACGCFGVGRTGGVSLPQTSTGSGWLGLGLLGGTPTSAAADGPGVPCPSHPHTPPRKGRKKQVARLPGVCSAQCTCGVVPAFWAKDCRWEATPAGCSCRASRVTPTCPIAPACGPVAPVAGVNQLRAKVPMHTCCGRTLGPLSPPC